MPAKTSFRVCKVRATFSHRFATRPGQGERVNYSLQALKGPYNPVESRSPKQFALFENQRDCSSCNLVLVGRPDFNPGSKNDPCQTSSWSTGAYGVLMSKAVTQRFPFFCHQHFEKIGQGKITNVLDFLLLVGVLRRHEQTLNCATAYHYSEQ